MMNKKQLDALERMVRNAYVDEVPKGWMTARQFAKQRRRTLQHTQRMLNRAHERNPEKIDTKYFTISTGKRTYPVLHYYVKA